MRWLRCLAVFAVMVSVCGVANATLVQINFDNVERTIEESTWGVWNQLISPTGDVVYDAGTPGSGLLDDAGASTGWSLITDDTARLNGVNSNGTTSPTGDAAAIFPGAVTNYSCYGNTSNFNDGGTFPLAKLLFSGLDPSATYDLVLVGSRMGVTDNRETLFKAIGANTVQETLGVANNTSEIAQLIAVAPNGQGEIELQISPGTNNNNSYGFFYVGGMTMEKTVVPEPGTLALLGFGAVTGLFWLRRRRASKR